MSTSLSPFDREPNPTSLMCGLGEPDHPAWHAAGKRQREHGCKGQRSDHPIDLAYATLAHHGATDLAAVLGICPGAEEIERA